MKRLFVLLFALLPMLVSAQGVTPSGYDKVQRLSDGTAIVMLNGKYGLIANTGEVIAPPEYKNIKQVANGRYLLISNELSVIDSKGNPAHDVMIYTSSNGDVITPNYLDVSILSNTYSSGLGVIIFDRPITSIGGGAFWDCTSLTSVTIPSSVTSIGYETFRGCTSLTNVTIPNSVTLIGSWAFSFCTSLKSITIPNSVIGVGDNVFNGCTSLPVIDGMRYAGTYLVEAVDKTRTSYTIKPGTRFIGSKAFEDCSSLTSITIPNSVTEIGDYAFSRCASLTSITIPNSVTKIIYSAFSGCTSLRSVIISNSVTEIGWNAFYGCTSLKEVYCKAKTPPTAAADEGDWSAFSDNASGRKIYVPRASVEAYKQADYWKDYASDIVGYDF